jgi:hypothetical protein
MNNTVNTFAIKRRINNEKGEEGNMQTEEE